MITRVAEACGANGAIANLRTHVRLTPSPYHMAQKSSMSGKRRPSRLPAALVLALLIVTVTVWAGCGVAPPESKMSPPKPHALGDITVKGSADWSAFTPTTMVRPEPSGYGRPVGDTAGPDGSDAVGPSPAAPKQPETSAGEPAGAPVERAKRGGVTIQIGAYIIEENLVLAREKITSLGFTPYVTEIGRKMPMFCVIVAEAKTQADTREIASSLSAKGFGARLLPGNDNTVDVAGGIYYYKGDASAAERRITALGYPARGRADG